MMNIDTNIKGVILGLAVSSLTMFFTSYSSKVLDLDHQGILVSSLSTQVDQNTTTTKKLAEAIVELKMIVSKLDTIVEIKLREEVSMSSKRYRNDK